MIYFQDKLALFADTTTVGSGCESKALFKELFLKILAMGLLCVLQLTMLESVPELSGWLSLCAVPAVLIPCAGCFADLEQWQALCAHHGAQHHRLPGWLLQEAHLRLQKNIQQASARFVSTSVHVK